MKYTYHYYAIHQPAPGQVAHIHGILTVSSQISTGKDFTDLCECIAESNGTTNDKLTICSLTIIATNQ
jgi:hypothetical protein